MKAVNSLLVIAILLFATVISWTYFAAKSTNNSPLPQAGIGGGPVDSTGSDIREQFQTLISEHGNLAVAHLSDLYDGKDTSDTAKKLDDNAIKLANLIKQFGTSTDRELFLQDFRGHIKDYENYTKARKANNQPAMNEAKENLRMHAMEFGDLVHKLMPTISKETATQLMSDHMSGTLEIVDAHAIGDTAKELTAINQAKAQGIQFANTLADGANALGE
jgi:hypothetical protein